MKQLLNIIIIIAISLTSIAGYHTFIIKKRYIPKSEIYVVDTTKILQRLAERAYNKEISTDELKSRVGRIQEILNKHSGLVFEMGALPGQVQNNIQDEFKDIIEK